MKDGYIDFANSNVGAKLVNALGLPKPMPLERYQAGQLVVKGTVLAYGPTETVFTHDNLETAFGGVLRHFTLGGQDLHDDDDGRELRIITDDERPFVHYGERIDTSEDDT